MRYLSFRLKLLLAMMLVVAGATGTALYISQKQVEATDQKLFEQRSSEKIQSFTDLQDARLGTVKDQCLDLVISVRVQQALETALEGGDNDATNLLYSRVESELATRGVRNDAVFSFFNSQGHLLLPTAAAPQFNR